MIHKVGPTNTHVIITTATAHHLGHLLRHRLHHHFHLGFKRVSRLDHVAGLKDVWRDQVLQLRGVNFLQIPNDVFSATCSSCLSFFNGDVTKRGSGDEGLSNSQTSRRNSSGRRHWTNILLAINVVVYVAQFASQGKLLLWGAKINSLIDRGQIWRLVTSSFLHANIGHLMVNCYSLNSIGPTMESFSGPRRYLAVYFASAIASSAMSYRFCKAPSVGASGAIFGLVGSVAVFVIRHKGLVGNGREDLQHIAQVIMLNMVIGLLSKGIDNWGHLGGLLGGAAVSWFLGPAWKYQSMSNDGRKVFIDRAPISYLFNKKRTPRQLN